MQAIASGGRLVEEVIQSRQGLQQLKEEPPDRQGKESIQAITTWGRPVEEAIQNRHGKQKLKEKPPDSQGKE